MLFRTAMDHVIRGQPGGAFDLGLALVVQEEKTWACLALYIASRGQYSADMSVQYHRYDLSVRPYSRS